MQAMVAQHFRNVPEAVAASDDLVQVAMEAVCMAAARWDPSRASFSTFAQFRAHGAVQDYLRRQSFGGRYHHGEFEFVSLYAPSTKDGDSLLAEIIPGRFEFEDPLLRPDIDRVLSTLPLDTQSAWELHVDQDMTLSEIAAIFGVTESMIAHRISNARYALAADPAIAEYREAA